LTKHYKCIHSVTDNINSFKFYGLKHNQGQDSQSLKSSGSQTGMDAETML